MKNWCLYILRCADNTYYTGITNNFSKRLEAHEKGVGAKYTKGRGPFKLMYKEFFKNRSQALKREIEVKSLSRAEKESLFN